MRVLLVKTSSLGDIIHTLPALTDAHGRYPGLQVDWLVEEGMTELPGWHPAVHEVIPVATRRWRKSLWKTWRGGEISELKARLQAQRYDRIVDAQGLFKTVWLTRLNPALSYGYDRKSIREPGANWFYDQVFAIPKDQHAVERNRQLLASALNYTYSGAPDYGLQLAAEPLLDKPYVFLFHGTTWATKHFPERAWKDLVGILLQRGLQPVVTWGNDAEKQRAQRLVKAGAVEFPRTSLQALARALKGARGAVAVDTGLGHLAAALDVPTVGLYGPTNPDRSGIYGRRQVSLQAPYHCAPCMKRRCRFEVLGKGMEQGFEPPCWSALSAEGIYLTLRKLLA